MPRRNSLLLGSFVLIGIGWGFGMPAVGQDGNKAQGKEVKTWQAPAGEKLFEDYTLRVGGRSVPVYACRVSAMPFNQVWPGYQRPLDQTELAGFAYWEMSGRTTVEIVTRQPFKSLAIRPISRNIQPKVNGQRITFQISSPGQFTVELDGTHHALHLFADPEEAEVPRRDDPKVLYYGPGVHHPGKIQLKSGQTLYVASGAVVYTAISGRGVSGVRIMGRGIIDTSEYAREEGGGSIHLSDCSDVKIQGVVLRDPDEWTISMFGCRNVEVSHVKLVGLWRYNSDGIDVCNSQDVTIRDSFVRSFDDSIVIKGIKWKEEDYSERATRNIHVNNMVIWCDWGRALEIGAETRTPEIAGVVFRDIDVIHNSFIAMDIQHGDRAAVHDIHFKDVRVEVDDFNPLPRIQKQRIEAYNPSPDAPVDVCSGCAPRAATSPYFPDLFVIIIRGTGYSADQVRGTVRDVTYKDISVIGRTMLSSSFIGYDTAHDVQGVKIENLRFQGRPLASESEARIQVGKFVKDVRIVQVGNTE